MVSKISVPNNLTLLIVGLCIVSIMENMGSSNVPKKRREREREEGARNKVFSYRTCIQ
jgi:hypothetical protein